MENEELKKQRKKRKAELSLELLDFLDVFFRMANGNCDGFGLFILKNDRINEKFITLSSIIEPFDDFPIAAQQDLDEELDKKYRQFDGLVSELTSFCNNLNQKYKGEGA